MEPPRSPASDCVLALSPLPEGENLSLLKLDIQNRRWIQALGRVLNSPSLENDLGRLDPGELFVLLKAAYICPNDEVDASGAFQLILDKADLQEMNERDFDFLLQIDFTRPGISGIDCASFETVQARQGALILSPHAERLSLTTLREIRDLFEGEVEEKDEAKVAIPAVQKRVRFLIQEKELMAALMRCQWESEQESWCRVL